MMEKIRYYLLAGLIMLLWSHAVYAQTAPPNNESTDCGQTLDFDGVDEYVAVPYSAATNPSSMSVSVWAYVKGFNGEFQAVAASRNSGPLRGWTLYITPDNKFLLMAGAEGDVWYNVIATDDVQLNTWTHLAFTLSGTEAVLYVNGTSLPETMSGNYVPNYGSEMRIGAGVTNETPAKALFNGQVDEFTLWNRALTAAEVANLHTGTDIGTTGLVAYYDFNAESGNATLTDRSGNGHSGTLKNIEANEDWLQTDRSHRTLSLWYADLDGDGYASSVVSCTSPGAGYSDSLGELLEGDCDDTNATINPGKTEVMGNGIDDDCNPVTFDMLPFVTTWKTDNYGTSGSNQITIPTTGSGYDYTVYWESTTDAAVNGVLTDLTGNTTITFPEAGTYRVKIAGDFPRIYFNSGGDKRKIITIEQWGDIAWASMERAFMGCYGLTKTASDAPDLSGVTNMSYMFHSTTNFNSDLNNWDVSNVTNMSYMFNDARSFNGDLSAWDVSSVTDMAYMFSKAYAFNGDLSAWDVSSVTNMSYMFSDVRNFTSDLSTWNVSNVANTSYMFSGAQNFTSNLSTWNVSNVTNMAFMFYFARSFNSDLSTWDVSSVTDMRYMFMYASAFSSDLGAWDISNVTGTNMDAMLSSSGMSIAHYDATLAGWATLDAETETKIPSGIYLGASGLEYCDAANHDILVTTYSWTIYEDTDISALSGEPLADKLPAIISAEAVQSLVAPQAVNYCTGDTLTAVTDATLPITATTTITWTYADGNEGTEDIKQQQHIFVGRPFVFTWEGEHAYLDGDSDYDYSYVIDWGDGDIDTLQSDDPGHTYATEGPHTISVYGQFPGVELGSEGGGLRSVEQWGDIEWRTMRYMFANTNPVFNATDVPNLSQVTDMSSMFRNATAFNSDISAWDVSSVTNMESMFREARAFNQPIGTWNVSNVTNMMNMFYNASAFNGDLSNWNVSSVINMNTMFYNATAFNGDLSNWNVSSVTNMYAMFYNATAFNGDLSGWDISSVTNMSSMLSQSGMSAAHYDATLAGWATLGVNETKIPTAVSLGAHELFYCSPTGRESLTTNYGWMISGDSDASALSGLPQQKELPVIVSDEPVTNLKAPIAVNCAGETLTAVTDVALPITAGTTITWTYPDGDDATQDITQQQYVYIGRPFVFTWEGDYVYLEGDPGYDYSYIIDWGDEAIDTLQSYDPEHTYATEGPHTITVYGQFPGMALGEESGLRSVEQWGDIEWRTMRNMFAYTSPKFNATDVPNLSQVNDMSRMFYNSGFNGDISAWDVSSVTNMESMFREARAFNQPIGTWNVSNVTNMSWMFQSENDNTAFNQDISGWDVSNVTAMHGMFRGAVKFNQDISNWDVNKVTNMRAMFAYATSFNQDLSAWDISSVTDMHNMLNGNGLSISNYDATLAGWATLDPETETRIPIEVDLGAEGLFYCNPAGHESLTVDYGWTINGDSDASSGSGVPQQKELPVIVSEEPVTTLEAPVAVNCAGEEITAVTDVTLPITAGTTITWTYADGNEATEDVTQQQQVFVGRPFVFTAETFNNEFIVQPHFDFVDQTNILIDWGDGTTSHYDGSDPYNDLPFDYHEYADQGVYTVSIYGDLHGITTEFYYGENLGSYLRSVEQWGDVEWKTMEGAFEGADNLQINATDAPDLSQVTSMSGMFRDATHFNADLSAWDVSNVTDMSGMLSNSGMSIRQYEATLKGWGTLGENEAKIPTGITLGADGINYCDATGRDILVNDYGWSITDAGSYCPAPPVLAVLEDKAANEGETLSFKVAATAGELPFEYKLDAASLAKGMTLDPTTGMFSWTPTPTHVGAHSVIITLDDGQSPLVSDTFTITVNAMPVLAAVGDQSVNEDETLTFTASATDVDDTEFTFSLDDASLSKGMAFTSSGAFSWTPVQEQVGVHSVTLTVSDGELTGEESFTITVNAVNDAPVLTSIGDQSVNEGEALTFTASATDVDDAEFTFSLDDASLSKGMAITSSGAFSWTPVQEQVGVHSVTLTVNDGELTGEEGFTITVNAVNDALEISSNAGLTLTQGGAAEITSELLSVTDTDNTPAELVYTVTALPANGTLKKGETTLAEHSTFTQADIDNGLMSYTHDGFNEATDEFLFTVTDGSTTLTSTFAISINIVMATRDNSIGEVNLYPVPAEDVVTLRINNAYRGNVIVQLFDVNGREMLTEYTVKDRAELVHSINVTSIPSGVVLVHVKTGNHTQSLRMIKK